MFTPGTAGHDLVGEIDAWTSTHQVTVHAKAPIGPEPAPEGVSPRDATAELPPLGAAIFPGTPPRLRQALYGHERVPQLSTNQERLQPGPVLVLQITKLKPVLDRRSGCVPF